MDYRHRYLFTGNRGWGVAECYSEAYRHHPRHRGGAAFRRAWAKRARRVAARATHAEIAQGLDDHADELWDWELGISYQPLVWDHEAGGFARDFEADCLCHHPRVDREPMTYSTADH